MSISELLIPARKVSAVKLRCNKSWPPLIDLVLSTLGILVASLYSSGQRISAKAVIRRIIMFMPFQAFVVVSLLMPFEYPVWLDKLLKRLGARLVKTKCFICQHLRLDAVMTLR